MSRQADTQHLTLDAPSSASVIGDRLHGSAIAPGEVVVSYNGRPWATVPVETGVGLNYSCQLPAVAEPTIADIEVTEKQTGRLIARLRQIHRKPLTNPYGLRASEVLDLHAAPLFDPFNMVFDGTTLTVYGAHLPPEGDPS